MKRDSLALKAYTEIRRKILSAQISPKTRLKEDYWATKLNVSRMAIRETLTRLLGEQLVTLGPKGGYFVSSMSAEDVVQIRELLRPIPPREDGVLGRCVSRGHGSDILSRSGRFRGVGGFLSCHDRASKTFAK